MAGRAERIVRLRDGKVVSDALAAQDPIHRDWIRRMGEGHAALEAKAGLAPATAESGADR